MEQSEVTLIVGSLGICGTLGGIVVGNLLTRSWQRKQWLWDKRAEELKELSIALADSLAAAKTQSGGTINSDNWIELGDAHSKAFTALRSRVFAYDIVSITHMEDKWRRALEEYWGSRDGDKLTEVFVDIRFVIVKAGRFDYYRSSGMERSGGDKLFQKL